MSVSDDYESFIDSQEISQYAALAVDKLCSNGVISGVGDGRFAPQENANRAMACRVVYAVLTEIMQLN